MPGSAIILDDVSWGQRRPGYAQRVLGATALVSTLLSGLLLGTNNGRLHPGTYSEPHPLGTLGTILLPFALIAGVSYLIAALSPPNPMVLTEKGRVRVEGGAIHLPTEEGAAEQRVPLVDVEAGWFGGLGRAVLRLRDGRELLLEAPRVEDAEALLVAVGVVDRVARLPVGSALSAVTGGRALGCGALLVLVTLLLSALAFLGSALVSLSRGLMGAGELVPKLLPAVPVLLALLGVLRLQAPRRVVVGADGLAIEGLFGRRFLPFAEIESAEETSAGVVLRRKRGLLRTVRLPLAPGGEKLHAFIAGAMRALDQGPPALDVERLDRGDRPLATFLADLRALTLDSGADYRRRALLPEQLAAVAEDPAAPRARRLAAAVAVAVSRDEAARGRLRIAAEASADEELAAALEAAAEGEIAEEALERASRR